MSASTTQRKPRARVPEAEAQDAQATSFVLHVNRAMSPQLFDRIQQALQDVGVEASLEPAPWTRDLAPAGQIATKKGEELLVRWTQDGHLIDGKSLSAAWSISRQALDKARERGDIFSIKVGGQHYYPAEVLKLTRADIADINRRLDGVDACSKMIFLMRTHGALTGLTPARAIEQGMRDDVLRLASSWATT